MRSDAWQLYIAAAAATWGAANEVPDQIAYQLVEKKALADAKSFKGLEDQFAETIKSFKSTWQPPQAAAVKR